MTKIFRLNESLADETTQLLRRLFADSDVSLGSDNASNSIVASGDSETIRQIEDLLRRLDRPAPRGGDTQKQSAGGPADPQKANPTEVLRSFSLRNIRALDAQRMLRQNLPNFTGRVAVDDRTNSILIGSDSETLNKVAEILQRLDQLHGLPARDPNPPATGNVRLSRQQIQQEIDILRSKRSEKEKELKLQTGIPNAVATPESKRLEEELHQLAQQITRLETELRNAPNTVAEPKTPPAPTPADLSNAEKFARLSRQIAQLDELISKLETELDGKWKELSPLLLLPNVNSDSNAKKESLQSDVKFLDLRITALINDKQIAERAMKRLWDDAVQQGSVPDHLLRAEIETDPRMLELQKQVAQFQREFESTASVAKSPRSNPVVAGKGRQLAAMREEAEQLYTELRESALARLMYGEERPEETIPVLEKRVERLGEMMRKDEAILQKTNAKLAALSKDFAEVEALKAQIEDLSKSNEELAKKLDVARADLANNREKPDLLEKTQILQRQHSANEEELRRLRAQKVDLSKKLGVGDDLNETKREQVRLLTEIEHIRNGLHTLSQRHLNAKEELERLKAKAEAMREGKIPEALLRDEIHKNPRMIKLQEKIAEFMEEYKYTAAVAKQPTSNPAVQRYERRLREWNQKVEQLHQQLREETLRKRGYLSDRTGKPPIAPDPFAPRFESPDPFAPRTGTTSDDPFAPRVDPGAAKSSKEKAPPNAPEKSSPR